MNAEFESNRPGVHQVQLTSVGTLHTLRLMADERKLNPNPIHYSKVLVRHNPQSRGHAKSL